MLLIRFRYLQSAKTEITTKHLAQELEDSWGAERFNEAIIKMTKLEGHVVLEESMRKRLSYLARIPFRAIITTNFNNLLDGDQSLPSPQAAAGAGSAGGAATAISKGVLNPQHNFEKILRPAPGDSPLCVHWSDVLVAMAAATLLMMVVAMKVFLTVMVIMC